MDSRQEKHGKIDYSVLTSFKFILLIIVISYLISMYYILRFNFLILDSDAIVLSNAIKALLQTEDITQSFNLYSYSNGVLYQLFSYIFIKFNNITIDDYQQIIRPILGSLTIFSGILFFYIFFKKKRADLALSLILFLLSPIILSQSTRASHAILSFSFFLLSLYFFINYIITRNPNFFLLLCIINFSLSVTNLLFGFVLTICQIILLFYFLYESKFLNKSLFLNHHKILLLSSILFIIFIIGGKYTYKASYDMMTNVFSIIFDTTLKTTSESLIIPSAYTYIATWKNPFVYWGIIYLYNITVLPFSLIIYFLTLHKFYIKKMELNFLERLTMICFGFFGLVVTLAIFVDFLGLSIGSNLQYRVIVYFIPFSIVVIVLFSNKFFKIAKWSTFFSAVKLILCIIFLTGSLIYITGDPYFSNNWRFTDNNEKTSILWLEGVKYEQNNIWTGDAIAGPRIQFVSRLFNKDSWKTDYYSTNEINSQYFIMSPILIDHLSENLLPIPNLFSSNKIYSNDRNYLIYFKGS